MNTQPEALQIADWLDAYDHEQHAITKAAAELRRLHSELEATDRQVNILTDQLSKCDTLNQELLEACQTLVGLPGTENWQETLHKAVQQARAAIDKAEEQA